jgi:hypothetical protein
MPALRVACGAFLIAVLVCDLTFDLAVFRAPSGDPVALDRALGAMTQYYGRITARGSLFATSVALVMAGLLVSLGCEAFFGPPGYGLARFALENSLAVGSIAIAVLRTFPRARRLGEGDLAARVDRARSIARDHLLVLPLMLAYVSIQLSRA